MKANELASRDLRKIVTTISGIILSASLAGTSAHALNLNDLMPKEEEFKMELNVACGEIKKSNCATVLPRLAEYTVPKGLSLVPVESEGSVKSSQAVCVGAVNAAVVQWDAADAVARDTRCVGKLRQVGLPIYPYYGFLVVRADFPFDSLAEMAENPPTGRAWRIADGKTGSGGQVTFENILKGNPEWGLSISEAGGINKDQAFQQLQDGSIDGFFIMDGLTSDTPKKFKEARDERKRPLFRFINVSLSRKFYASMKDWRTGAPLYYEAMLEKTGWFSSIQTIAVNAVLVMNQKFLDTSDGTTASNVLSEEGIKKSSANIRGDLMIPRDWRGGTTRE